MTTTIDMTKEIDTGNRDSFLVWAVLALISDGKKDLYNEIFKAGRVDGHCIIDVDLKFNGVDVDFKVLLDRLGEAFDHEVKKAARDLVNEKCCAFDRTIEDAKRKIREDLNLGEEERW